MFVLYNSGLWKSDMYNIFNITGMYLKATRFMFVINWRATLLFVMKTLQRSNNRFRLMGSTIISEMNSRWNGILTVNKDFVKMTTIHQLGEILLVTKVRQIAKTSTRLVKSFLSDMCFHYIQSLMFSRHDCQGCVVLNNCRWLWHYNNCRVFNT